MPSVRNADAVLHYDVAGEGEPLLILPGLAMDIGPWRPLASMLVGFKIVLIDNRDAGGSSTTAQQYALSDMSADVRAVLDDLGLEQVNILGHSLGGQIAQEFALRDPNRVRKLILANSWARTDQYLANKFETWRILKRHLPDAHFREVMTFNLSHPDVLASAPLHAITALTNPLFHDQSADAFCRGANAASHADTLDRLNGLASPTLVISGERDVVLPAPYADELTNAIPNATRIRLETAGHAAPWEASEIFVNEVRGFLKRAA